MKRLVAHGLAIVAALSLAAAPSLAQQSAVTTNFQNAAGRTVPVTPSNPLPVTSVGGSSGGPATIADGADVTQGALADGVYSGSGNATINSVLKGIYARANSLLLSYYNEDAVHATGDRGVAQLCVRSTNYYSTTTSSAAGDYDVCHTAPDGSVLVNLPDGSPITVTPATSAAVLFTADTLGYAGVGFQISGTWAGTVTFEGSNDNTNWIVTGAVNSSGTIASSTASTGAYYYPAAMRYLRARVSTYTSGTVNGTALYRSTPLAPTTALTIPLPTGTNDIGTMSPKRATTTRTNGTITTANTFQSVLASNTSRLGCTITNTSANAMTIDLGASPAAATARPLPAGASFDCSTLSNVVATDQINLTSPTAGSTFVVWSQ